MSTLRLPLRGRPDVCIFHFPQHVNPDQAAEKVCSDIRAQAKRDKAPIPALRVIPLTDRSAYAEAIQISIDELAGNTLAVWIADTESARVSYRSIDPKTKVEREYQQTIRIVQVLLN